MARVSPLCFWVCLLLFFFLTALLGYKMHPFEVHNPLVSHKFSKLYSLSHGPIFEHFHHSKKVPVPPCSQPPAPPQPQVTTDVLSIEICRSGEFTQMEECTVLSVQLLSLCITCSRSIHAVPRVSTVSTSDL